MVVLRAKKRMRWEVPQPERVIEFPAGLQVPAGFRFSIEDYPAGYDVDIEVAWSDVRFVCTDVRVRQRPGSPAVSGEVLRAVPVQDLIRDGFFLALVQPGRRSKDEQQSVVGKLLHPPDGLAEQGPTDEVLRWVAQIYEFARAIGDPPAKSVQDGLSVSRATAGRWVAEARRRGLLESGEG